MKINVRKNTTTKCIFSEEKFFVTKNLHLVTKFIIRRKKRKKSNNL